MTADYDLQRFLDAQEDIYPAVLAELRSGRKRSHWMWFIFPQIAGLGSSPTAQRYAIDSLDEARAYAEHPVLGNRLRECAGVVMEVAGRSIEDIFGYPDNMKFRSSMTLFSRASPLDEIFLLCLQKYFGGMPDTMTVEKLGRA